MAHVTQKQNNWRNVFSDNPHGRKCASGTCGPYHVMSWKNVDSVYLLLSAVHDKKSEMN